MKNMIPVNETEDKIRINKSELERKCRYDIDKENGFRDRKRLNLKLSESLFRIGETERAIRCKTCGTPIWYEAVIRDGVVSRGKFKSAWFCEDRLCALCSWNKYRKIRKNLSDIVDYLYDDTEEYSFILLTLTVSGRITTENLNSEYDNMERAWSVFRKSKEFTSFSLGFFKATEITVNYQYADKSVIIYHPHIHAIIAVRKDSYRTQGECDVLQKTITGAWSRITGKYINPNKGVNIKPVAEGTEDYSELMKQTLETAAYVGKGDINDQNCKEYTKIFSQRERVIDTTVSALTKVLKNRHAMAMGGVFQNAKQALKIERMDDSKDVEELAGTTAEDEAAEINSLNSVVKHAIVQFQWNNSMGGNYVITNVDFID